MRKSSVITFAALLVATMASGCSSKDDRGTCVSQRSVKSCSVNQVRYQCEGPGDVFTVKEAGGAGALRCKGLGFPNPMNTAYDLEGKTYRLDVPVGDGERHVQEAIDKGHTVTFFEPSYPRFR